MQIPGIDPEFLARDLLHRLDDKLDLTQAFKAIAVAASIVAMNTQMRGGPGGPTPPGQTCRLPRQVQARSRHRCRGQPAIRTRRRTRALAAASRRRPQGNRQDRRNQPPAWAGPDSGRRIEETPMSTLGIVLVVIPCSEVLLGGVGPYAGVGSWGPGYGYGYGGIGVVGILLIVLLIAALSGRI